MALRVTTPLFVAQYVQAGRPTNTSTSASVMPHLVAPPLGCISQAGSFRSLSHQMVKIDGRLRGGCPPFCFVTACTNDTSREQPSFPKDSIEPGEDRNVTKKGVASLPDCYFLGTPYIPVYVMLPLGVVNKNGELDKEEGDVIKDLHKLRAVGVDGVMVNCCWGIVESNRPLEYNWSGYKRLFEIIRHEELKVQVVMCFHKCRDNDGNDITIPLPYWVREIGKANPDIYFTGRDGRRNTECLTWGIDKERVLRGRTALEVYFDFMRSFRVEMDEFFENGIISNIEVGMGPYGELCYPSYPMEHGRIYPGIGELQCYDKYLMKNLRNAVKEKSNLYRGEEPVGSGTYSSRPVDTGFFLDGTNYDGYYWRFFLSCCSKVLLDHADHVLRLAKLAFGGCPTAAKISSVHAAELTAGLYNTCNQDGYAPIAEILKKHDTALKFTGGGMCASNQHDRFHKAMSDCGGLVRQVLNAAWDAGIPVTSENALPCFDRDGFDKILEYAKPYNDPIGRHLLSFTYLKLGPPLYQVENLVELNKFIEKMHGCLKPPYRFGHKVQIGGGGGAYLYEC